MPAHVSLVSIPIALSFIWLAVSLGPGLLAAAVPEGTVEFQDGAGNAKLSYAPGEAASFYIRDSALAIVGTSTATWTNLSIDVPAGDLWSLASGAPDPAAFELSQGSQYDTTAPANTPLRPVPTATVNDVITLPADFNDLIAITGEFPLLNDVNASSTLRVDFTFDVVDGYPLSANRASVTSTSDLVGEWVSIGEVASETDPGASPTSGLFRGEVLLSADPAAMASVDGAVWVQDGDSLTVSYYESDGATLIGSHQATADFPAPPPTPTPEAPPPALPAGDWLPLIVLAGLLALAAAWLTTRRPRSAGSPKDGD